MNAERPIAVGARCEPGTARGLMSIELAVGLDVVLLGAPAHPRLRAAATASPVPVPLIIMREIEACASRHAPRMLRNDQVFEL